MDFGPSAKLPRHGCKVQVASGKPKLFNTYNAPNVIAGVDME